MATGQADDLWDALAADEACAAGHQLIALAGHHGRSKASHPTFAHGHCKGLVELQGIALPLPAAVGVGGCLSHQPCPWRDATGAGVLGVASLGLLVWG